MIAEKIPENMENAVVTKSTVLYAWFGKKIVLPESIRWATNNKQHHALARHKQHVVLWVQSFQMGHFEILLKILPYKINMC